MDFGKLQTIAHVDFTLPADNAGTQVVLQQHKQEAKPEVYIGLPVWVNKAWAGSIYPASMREKDSLLWYGRQFNTIELNSTHYHIPGPTTIDRWRNSVPRGFKFCPKFPQLISHEGPLRNTQSITTAFFEAIAGLEDNLGSSFLQLPPYFGPDQLPDLEAFLRFIPESIPVTIEFRHPDWFTDEVAGQELFELLEKYEVGTVITDVAGRRDVLHMRLTTPAAMIRFVGNGLHPTDYSRIDAWVQRLKLWFDSGLQQLYFFVHEPDNTLAPELAIYLIGQLNEVCGLNLKVPKKYIQPVQGELF
ncbi:DUF72 domain-containing protein [Pontibacter burrus]|uniref:DUF72 domain-containing protein n=1 Tax=Pontibacter burrus TaxID=2704466 RepID=A0A6B3LN44_9BACT|nr:DUF72 domain-containing protein [Pontibacter burrus]NEM96485.1 DUF72 domain-containing protein [Pontibacter burrus]